MPSETLLNAKLNYLLYGIYTEWNDAENATRYAKKAIELAEKQIIRICLALPILPWRCPILFIMKKQET
jgi:hypothetical protein